jgi:hypothetical protein
LEQIQSMRRHAAVRGEDMQIVRELGEVSIEATIHPRRRMVVLRRQDGRYSCAEQYYFTAEYEGAIAAQGWQSLSPEGIFETGAAAASAAKAIFLERYERALSEGSVPS